MNWTFSGGFYVRSVFSFACVCYRGEADTGRVLSGGLEFLSHTPAANIINSSLNALGYSAFVARLFCLYYMVDQTYQLIENICMLVFLPSYEPNPVSPRLLQCGHLPPASRLHASATRFSPPHYLSEPATQAPLCTSAEKATALPLSQHPAVQHSPELNFK